MSNRTITTLNTCALWSKRSAAYSLLTFLVFLSLIGPLPATAKGKKVAPVEYAATIFRKACLQTATTFTGFADTLTANDFFDDGHGYFIDGVHNLTLQIWKGEGRTFCTLFYTQARSGSDTDQEMMLIARQFTEIGVPVGPWKPSRYDRSSRRYLSKLARDLTFEHKYMEEAETGHLLRASLVVPNK